MHTDKAVLFVSAKCICVYLRVSAYICGRNCLLLFTQCMPNMCGTDVVIPGNSMTITNPTTRNAL